MESWFRKKPTEESFNSCSYTYRDMLSPDRRAHVMRITPTPVRVDERTTGRNRNNSRMKKGTTFVRKYKHCS